MARPWRALGRGVANNKIPTARGAAVARGRTSAKLNLARLAVRLGPSTRHRITQRGASAGWAGCSQRRQRRGLGRRAH